MSYPDLPPPVAKRRWLEIADLRIENDRLRARIERLRAALQDIAEDPYAIDGGAAEIARTALAGKEGLRPEPTQRGKCKECGRFFDPPTSQCPTCAEPLDFPYLRRAALAGKSHT